MTTSSEKVAWFLVVFQQVCIVFMWIYFERYNQVVLKVLQECRLTIDHYNKHVKSIIVLSTKTEETNKKATFEN